MVSKEIKKIRREVLDVGKFSGKSNKGLTAELPQVQQQVQQQKTPFGIQRKQKLPQSERPFNFFAHRSEKEVYGDEGLTLFDSQKGGRSQGATGSLFGI